MEFPITKEEVVKHLEELGYKNISDEKVDQFIQDLKRLIKYEEKKSRRKLKESQHRRGRPVSSRQEESVVSFTRSASLVSSYEGTSLSLSESASTSTSTTTRSSTSSEYNKVSLKRNRDVQVVIDVHPVKAKKDTVDSGTIFNDDTTRLRQILPPRVPMPTKPTVGFIKPREINTGLAKKSDPVGLYQHYKKIWDAKSFPGDGSDKNLRWTVREWMIGGKQG